MARTKMTRSQRLGKQGIVFFEVDGVLARLTGSQSKAFADEATRPVRAVTAVAVGLSLALQMRRRVRDERITAKGPFAGYSRIAHVVMSQQYADAAGLSRRYWPSSAAMHGQLPGGNKLFSVTGKMWEGLQVRGSGKAGAIIDFGGTSMGKGVNKIERTVRGKPVIRNKPAMVRNSEKAGGILAKTGVHILEPTDAEWAAAGVTVMDAVGRGVALAFSADAHSVIAPGFQTMVQQIRANLRRDGVM
tara:strand:+ start:2283 stop:3020 length:738 start_codon:yes stop_codon:yes gene_type:complete